MSILTRIADAASAGLDAAFDALVGRPHRGRVAAGLGRDAGRERAPPCVLAHPPPASERDPAVLGNRLTPALLAALIAQRNRGWMEPRVAIRNGTSKIST